MNDPDLIVNIIKFLEILQNVDDGEYLWPTMDFMADLNCHVCDECQTKGTLRFESNGDKCKAFCGKCGTVELGISPVEEKPDVQKDIQLYFPFASDWKLERHDQAIKFTVNGLTSIQMRDARGVENRPETADWQQDDG